MNRNKVETRLSINLLNPGHFFACCGILHAVDRALGSVLGSFDGNEFVLETERKDPIQTIVNEASHIDISIGKESASPIHLGGKIDTRLDFWEHFDNRPKIKLFAGQEKSHDVVGRWIEHMKGHVTSNAKELWNSSVIDVPSGFDTHASWNSLDVGFSLHVQNMKRRSFPVVEFFAYLGAQAYGWYNSRKSREEYCYNAWAVPLPNIVARAAAAGALEFPGTRHFRARTKKSGQKKTFIEAMESDTPC